MENFQIIFRLCSQTFANNKIYGVILIKPESSWRKIQHFQLLIDDHLRRQFPSTSDLISIAGFDRKEGEEISVKIIAILKTSTLTQIESQSCKFSFTGEVFTLNPIVRFKWSGRNVNINVKWQHLVGQFIEKYILILDEQEIQYVNQRQFRQEFEFCIHNLEPGTRHTVQIIGKVKKRKRDCRSDVVEFTVPNSQNESVDMEVLYMQLGFIPQILKDEWGTEYHAREELNEGEGNNPQRLLEKLRLQIEKRGRL